jgi:Protein of unknown function (DUF3800)
MLCRTPQANANLSRVAAGNARPAPRSFTGHQVERQNLVRMVHLDEAGISNPKHEPFVVVAGVVVHADKQWKDLERYLDELADQKAPRWHRQDFVFHAMELFSGGATFTRERFDKESRWSILDELVRIPGRFGLPVVAGWVERERLRQRYPAADTARLTLDAQVSAFIQCASAVELYMRLLGDNNDEVALIVMEENKTAHHFIMEAHSVMKNPDYHHIWREGGLEEATVTRIIDTVHFAAKQSSSPLQVADACAFAFKRHLMKTPENERFYAPLRRQMVRVPTDEVT